MTIDEYQSIKEAAERTGFAAVTIRKMCTAGDVPDAHLFGGAYWVVPKDWTPIRRAPGPRRANTSREG